MFRINEMSKERQIAKIRENPWDFQYILNPCLEVQLAAVMGGGGHSYAIKWIKNPCLEVQLKSVKRNGTSIRWIKNPSEEVQLEAIKENVFAIRYIKNPTEKVQIEAVKKKSDAIEYINNPCLEAQIIVANSFKSTIIMDMLDIELILNEVESIPENLFRVLHTQHYPFTEEFKNTNKYKEALVDYEI